MLTLWYAMPRHATATAWLKSQSQTLTTTNNNHRRIIDRDSPKHVHPG